MTVENTKPKLRGILHLVMAPISLFAGLVLVFCAPSFALKVASTVYLVTGVVLFTVSASYHRGHWSEKTSLVLRRFDHSNIFLFIAGSYTPLAVRLLSGGSRVILLCIIWGCAGLGVLMKQFWLTAPRWVYTLIYIGMGWAAVGWLPTFWHTGGPEVVWLLVAGGLCYTAGAVCYALKRPNPAPAWFGYHEIMHSGTVLGAVCHYSAIWIAVLN